MKPSERASVAVRVTLCASLPVLLYNLGYGLLVRQDMEQREAMVAAGDPGFFILFPLALVAFGGFVFGPVLGILWARSRVGSAAHAPAFIGLVPVYLVFFPWMALTPVFFLQSDAFFHWMGVSPSGRHPWNEIFHALVHPLVVFPLAFSSASWRGGSNTRDLMILALVVILVFCSIIWWGPPFGI